MCPGVPWELFINKKKCFRCVELALAVLWIRMVYQISFEEIVQGRDSIVRVTDDSLLYAVDLAMVVTGKTAKEACRDLRGIPEHVFPNTKFIERMISTRGGYPTKFVSFTNGIELVMVLNGDVARMTRVRFADIIRRYMAGDATLLGEINTNALSTSAIAQLARGNFMDPDALEKSKRKNDVEDEDLRAKKLQNVNLFVSTMALVNPNWREDSRLRLQTEDWLKNAAFSTIHAAITNGERAITQSISVSQVTEEMGLRFDKEQNKATGRLVAESYRKKYNEEPGTHAQWVDGAERQVKSYSERDRDLIENAIEIVKNKPKQVDFPKKRGPPRTMAV